MALVRIDVSEDVSVSIIRVTRIGERRLRRNTKNFFATCFGC
jgi:hypothetical protein